MGPEDSPRPSAGSPRCPNHPTPCRFHPSTGMKSAKSSYHPSCHPWLLLPRPAVPRNGPPARYKHFFPRLPCSPAARAARRVPRGVHEHGRLPMGAAARIASINFAIAYTLIYYPIKVMAGKWCQDLPGPPLGKGEDTRARPWTRRRRSGHA